MHGNEVMGREALLHLAAVLLHNYDRNLYIQQLLDTTRIHLMPTMNPDGELLRFDQCTNLVENVSTCFKAHLFNHFFVK